MLLDGDTTVNTTTFTVNEITLGFQDDLTLDPHRNGTQATLTTQDFTIFNQSRTLGSGDINITSSFTNTAAGSSGLNGTGIVTLDSGVNATLLAGLDLDNGLLVIAPDASLTNDSFRIRLTNDAAIAVDGVLEFVGDGDVSQFGPLASSRGTLIIGANGVVSKSGGTGLTDIRARVTNNGLIDVQSGRIDIRSGGGVESGDYVVANGSTLGLGGERTNSGDVTGAGDVEFIGDIQSFTGNFDTTGDIRALDLPGEVFTDVSIADTLNINNITLIDRSQLTLSGLNSTVAGNIRSQERSSLNITGSLASLGGLLEVAGESVTFSQAALTLPNLVFDADSSTTGAMLIGPTAFTVNAFDAQFVDNANVGGTVIGGGYDGMGVGSLTLVNGGVIGVDTFPGSGNTFNGFNISNGTLINQGTLVIMGPDDLGINNGAVIENLSGSVIDFQSDMRVDGVGMPGTLERNNTGIINNAGLITKSGGSGLTAIDVEVNNTGTITVQSGELALQRGGNSSGIFNINAGTQLQLGFSGDHLLDNNSVINGSGTLETANGNHLISGTVNFNGDLEVFASDALARTSPSTSTTITSDISVNDVRLIEAGAGLFSELLLQGQTTILGDVETSGVDIGGGLGLVIENLTGIGGTLSISDRDAVTISQNASIGALVLGGQTGGTLSVLPGVTVTITGSTTINSPTTAGQSFFDGGGTIVLGGDVLLDIAASASLRVQNTTVQLNGNFDWQEGNLIVGGDSTLINAGTFNVTRDDVIGGFGEIINQGTFQKSAGAGALVINPGFSNEGLLQVPVGTISFDGGFFQFNGETRLAGGTVSATSLVYDGGQVTGAGTLDVGTGSVTFIGAELAPGNSPGTININGDLILTPASILNLELGGAAVPNIDFINVTGFAALDGTLNVSVINGYVPNPTTLHTVLSAAGGVSGVFATENIVGATSFTSNVQPNNLELSVVPLPVPAAPAVFAAAPLVAFEGAMPILPDGPPDDVAASQLAGLIENIDSITAPRGVINDILVLDNNNKSRKRNDREEVREIVNQCY